jgi:CBASS immunity sensor of nucleotide second messenger signals
MSISNIPEKVKIKLWGKAAGRCQYEGCNAPLYLDTLTQTEFNTAYIAHIIADSPGGPRGDKFLSSKLSRNISNLMLMCDKHHRLIDREDIVGHTVERLEKMKKKHEDRIELQTSVKEDMQSHIVIYRSNIGDNRPTIDWQKAANAISPEKYPASRHTIDISLSNSPFKDKEKSFWTIERESLQRQYSTKIMNLLSNGDIQHLSIFAIAAQPLLIELGRFLSDIPTAEVFQLHKEPNNWKWQEHPVDFDYKIIEPASRDSKVVALNLSLSGTVKNDRIYKVLGDGANIWTITIDKPDNDYLKSKKQLSMFRTLMRGLFDRIKAEHGNDAEIHIFPAAPISINIELGRVWMPKADLNLMLYDENKSGFIPAFKIQ